MGDMIGILRVHYSSDFITFFVCILHKFAYSETKQDGLEFQILGTTGFSRLVTFNPHELLIGFVCFCGLSLLNAPWRTVPLLLPLFGSVPTDLA